MADQTIPLASSEGQALHTAVETTDPSELPDELELTLLHQAKLDCRCPEDVRAKQSASDHNHGEGELCLPCEARDVFNNLIEVAERA